MTSSSSSLLWKRYERVTLAFILTIVSTLILFANPCKLQQNQLTLLQKSSFRVDPPFWWVNMSDQRLQLLIQDSAAAKAQLHLSDARIRIIQKDVLENPDYVSIWLDLRNVKKACTFSIQLKWGNITKNYPYQLLMRNPVQTKGLNGGDLIYLIMPDRFSNGNPSNDVIAGMHQSNINRSEMYQRHGGDLDGIFHHLDYLQQTGITTLWLNPFQENDQPSTSYHGYAITDHYKVDPRLGTNADYQQLSNKLHKQKMKLVMDVVLNHCGNQHYFIRSLPSKNWLHQWDSFTRTHYNALPLLDPNAIPAEKKLLVEGWFDKHMPDLNQDHPVLKQYLIQNTLWWCEFAQLDGLRVDTWFYSDQKFMQDWLRAVYAYNPKLSIFSESWVQGCGVQAFFNNDHYLGKNAPPVAPIDFQVAFSIHEALTKNYSWEGGISKLHSTLSQDYLFRNPYQHLIFLDNHDLSRIFSILGEDLAKWKQAITLLMTLRGIPSVYYGTEILMKNFSDPDGKVREDFPGGWTSDTISAFLPNQMPKPSQEAYTFFTRLSSFRKSNTDFFAQAKFHQWLPQNGLYAYVRKTAGRMLLVIINTDDQTLSKNFQQTMPELIGLKAFDILQNEYVNIASSVSVPGRGVLILDVSLQH